MDEFEPSSIREALRCLSEIVHGTLIEVIQRAFSSATPHQCRNGFDEKAKLTLAPAERIFRLLPLVDVRQQHAPANDLPIAIAKWKAAVLNPAVDTIRATKPLHNLVRSTGRDRIREDLNDM